MSLDEPKVWNLTQFLGEAFEQADPIVENLLHKGELIILSATAKTGKSLFASQLALTVAKGVEPFLGKFNVMKSRVLIIQTEIGRAAYQQRLFQMIGAKIPLLPELLISDFRFRIDEAKGQDDLKKLLDEHHPELLILDPFFTLHRRDEDKAKEITPVLSWLKEIVIDSNLACLLIHHQGKRHETDNRQAGHRHRGSSALADIPDGSISLQRTTTARQCTISFELRNHEAPDPMTIRLDQKLNWNSIGLANSNGKSLYTYPHIFSKSEWLRKDAAAAKFEAKYKKKKRTFETFLKNGLMAGEILRDDRTDGTAWFSLAKASQ